MSAKEFLKYLLVVEVVFVATSFVIALLMRNFDKLYYFAFLIIVLVGFLYVGEEK